VRVFDANLLLGRLGWRPVGVESASEMLCAMDRFGIERGLVSHLTACIHDVQVGNKALFEAITGHEERLLPVPVVDLNDASWEDQVGVWHERGVRALRLAPAFYHNRMDDGGTERLAAVARCHGWPVVVTIEAVRAIPWHGASPSWAVGLARSFPDIHILALGASRSHLGELLAGLGECPNLYLELANIQTGFVLERLVDAGLEDRLLCGSNYGASYANVCIERIKRSSVNDAVKAKVLYENAFAFLGEL